MRLKETLDLATGFMKFGKFVKATGLTPRENMLMAYRHETPAYIPCTYIDAGVMIPYAQGERYTGIERGKDWFGVEWVYEPTVHAPMPDPGKHMFEDIADWRDFVRFPDLDAVDWEKAAYLDLHGDVVAANQGKGYVPLKRGKSVMDGGKLGYALVLNGMFERMHAFMGFENALVSLVTDPEECFQFFSAMADYKIEFFKKIAKYYPVDVINAHDDYGASDRMFMSPEVWRKLLKPNLKRMVDAVHELGLIYQHHSCGFIEPIIGDLVEIGVDALDPLQVTNKNIREIKDKYQSKLTFVGGMDNVNVLDVENATPEEIQNEYKRATDLLAPGGSFISFPHGLNFDAVPITFGGKNGHLRYGVPFYKKTNL